MHSCWDLRFQESFFCLYYAYTLHHCMLIKGEIHCFYIIYLKIFFLLVLNKEIGGIYSPFAIVTIMKYTKQTSPIWKEILFTARLGKLKVQISGRRSREHSPWLHHLIEKQERKTGEHGGTRRERPFWLEASKHSSTVNNGLGSCFPGGTLQFCRNPMSNPLCIPKSSWFYFIRLQSNPKCPAPV